MNPQFRVYVSCSLRQFLDSRQQLFLDAILDRIVQAGYIPVNLEGYFFPQHSRSRDPLDIQVSLDGMDLRMKESQGAIVLAFARWRICDDSGATIGFSPTEYNHFE